jgi:rhamnulokinase
MVPDYLNYILTGVMMNEYTNASSTGLVSAESKNWDLELIRKIGLPEEIFLPIQMPGTVVGELLPDIQKETGASLQVVLPATHDTGSAFLAVPARDDNAVFISSGTWSLLGVENQKAITSMESCRENFTNEGGYEYRFRYLKNIMGLWMFQNAKKEIDAKLPEGETVSFKELQDKADGYDLDVLVNVDDDRFLAPESMLLEVRKASQEQGVELPQDDEAVLNVIFRSLAADYAAAVKKLEQLTGKTYTAVNIVGGGSQNTYLNALTAKYTGLPVYAGPTEGTALGNLIVQFIHDGVFQDLSEARTAIADSFDIKEYS